MSTRWRHTMFVILAVAVLVFVLSTVASTAPATTADAPTVADLSRQVEQGQALGVAAERTPRVLGGGAILGLGVGLLVGTGAAFARWGDEI